MKTKTLATLLPLLVVGVALAAPPAKQAPAKKAPAGVQRATIVVDGGFKPASVQVKAGRPVELTFDTKRRGCATSVIFEGIKVNQPLTDGKKTVVRFTPKKSGTLAYACPMKMMTGKVVVN